MEMERWSVQKLFGNGSEPQLVCTGLAWCGPGQKREDQRLSRQKMPSRECLIALGIVPSFQEQKLCLVLQDPYQKRGKQILLLGTNIPSSNMHS